MYSHINLATWITLFRFVFALLLVVDYHLSLGFMLLWWVLAVVSDYVDGLIARSCRMHSSLGALLDPLADKCLVLAAFYVLLVQRFSLWVFCPCLSIVLRDIWISVVRINRYINHGQVGSVGVTWLSQCKTAMLMLAQFLLLYSLDSPDGLVYWSGFMLLYATALMSTYTIAGFLQSRDAPVYTQAMRE